MPTGYSKTPTARKLGIKPGSRVAALNAPAPYAKLIDGLPKDFTLVARLNASVDIVHAFITRRDELATRIQLMRKAIAPDGALWVSWPKKASKVPTDVTEDVIRNLALANGLVDVKVCAIDDVWSGLKLVIPVAQRG